MTKPTITSSISTFRFIRLVAEGAKKSPELIQLLELHTQFASITPYTQVRNFLGKLKNKTL